MNKPYIIAEVGSNWSTLDDCLISIVKAKSCGSDAVKYQLFDQNSLYGNNFYERDSRYELKHEWLPKLKQQCDKSGIDFMCTAFSPELIDVVDPYVNAHKVASAEMCHVRMLEKLNQIGKRVFLSTGANSLEEIYDALEYLGYCKVTLMYCVAAYPARYTDTERIESLKEEFGITIGYSDHSLDVWESPYNAVKNGAVAIEKHVNFVNHAGPDSPHSLTEDQFRHMICKINEAWIPYLATTPDEQEMIDTHKRRLIAIKDIKKGDKFIEGVNFGIYRALKPTKAASPFDIKKFIGKTSNSLIECGMGLSVDMISIMD